MGDDKERLWRALWRPDVYVLRGSLAAVYTLLTRKVLVGLCADKRLPRPSLDVALGGKNVLSPRLGERMYSEKY